MSGSDSQSPSGSSDGVDGPGDRLDGRLRSLRLPVVGDGCFLDRGPGAGTSGSRPEARVEQTGSDGVVVVVVCLRVRATPAMVLARPPSTVAAASGEV